MQAVSGMLSFETRYEDARAITTAARSSSVFFE